MTIHAIDASSASESVFCEIIRMIKATAASRDSVVVFDADIRIITHVSQIDNLRHYIGNTSVVATVIDWAKDVGEKMIVLYGGVTDCEQTIITL